MPAEILKPDEFEKAAKLLLQGKLVAFPTETVYGVGALADADHDSATLRAFKGGRPDPFSLHLPDREAAHRAVNPEGLVEYAALNLTPHGVTAILADLAGDGRLERRTDPDDRRRARLRLSGSGNDLYDRMGAAWLDAGRRYLADVDLDDLRAVARVLAAVARAETRGETR